MEVAMAEASGTQGVKTPQVRPAPEGRKVSVTIGRGKAGFSPIGWGRVGRRAQVSAHLPGVLWGLMAASAFHFQPSTSTLEQQ